MLLTVPSLLSILHLPLARGSAGTALKRPDEVLITEETAAKYFGNEDPIGQTLRIDRNLDLTVTGVLRDLPHNTHLRLDFLASIGGMAA